MLSGSSELKVNMFTVTHFSIWERYRRWIYLAHTSEHERWYSTWCGCLWMKIKTFIWTTLFITGYYRKLDNAPVLSTATSAYTNKTQHWTLWKQSVVQVFKYYNTREQYSHTTVIKG